MEILFTLLGVFCVVVMFALVGHGIWIVLAAITKGIFGQPPNVDALPFANTPEKDLRQTYLALDRLFRGKLISVDDFQRTCAAIEKAAANQGCALPWIPSKRLTEMTSGSESEQTAESLATETETVSSPAFAPVPSDSGIPAQEIHPLEKEYAPAPSPLMSSLATQTRRTMGDILQQFLSEKNIHWGELVSALLIVGSAVGLILSLRTELNRLIPMFPSVLFFVVTLAIHLAGFYTLKRWKLPSTSRGLLVLGSVMMCVTSLATVLLTEQDSAPVSSLVPIVVGGLGFGTLAFLSSASLFPGLRLLWTIAVTLSGISPLLLGMWLGDDINLNELRWASILAVVGPIVSVIGLVTLHFGLRSKAEGISLRAELRLLGIVFVGSLFSCGMLLFLLRGGPGSFHSLSLMLALLGGMLVCAGSILSFGSTDASSRLRAELSESLLDRVTVIGSAVSFLGAAVMIGSLGTAWGRSSLFLETAVLNTLISLVLVALWRQPTLTAIAAAFSTLTSWLLVHRFTGNFPDPEIRLSWVMQAMETVRSSGVFLMLAGIYAGIAWKTPRKHAMILQIAAALAGVIGIVIAAYLGCTAIAIGPHLYAVCCFALLGVVLTLLTPAKGPWEPAIFGSALLFFCWFMLARPETQWNERIGLKDWIPVDRAVFAFSGHAMTVAVLAALVGITRLLAKRIPSIDKLTSRCADPKFDHWISDSGLISVCIGAILLARPATFDTWIWQAELYAALAVCAWVAWAMGRGNFRESLGWLVSGASLCFFLAAGILSVSTSGQIIANSVSVSLSVAMVTIIGLGTVCSLVLHRTTRLARTRFKLKAWSTPWGDGMLIAASLLYLSHLVEYPLYWRQAVASSRMEAVLWTVSILSLFACAILLTALRYRALYIWMTGILSTITVFILFGVWNTQGGGEVAFAYLLMGAPQLVAGIASAFDVLLRRQPATFLGAKGLYETIFGGITLLFWSLVFCIGYLGNLEDPTIAACGLWSPVGGLWVAVGLISFWLASLVVHRRQFVLYLLFGTLLVACHLPIALARITETRLGGSNSFALLMIGAAVQVLVVSWFVLKGLNFTSFVRRYLKAQDGEADSVVRQLCWNYANVVSLWMMGVALLFGIMTSNPETVRLLALVFAILGFANGLLARHTSQVGISNQVLFSPVLFNRYLMIISIPLFALFVVWARLEYTQQPLLFVQRILRTASVSIATAVGFGLVFAWLSRASQEVDSSQSKTPSWRETLCHLWFGASGFAILFPFVGLLAILGTTNESMSMGEAVVPKRSYSVEVLWIAGLSGLWMVQLVVQAIRNRWNIANLNDSLRSAYVYTAEIVFILATVKLYAVFPEWFQLPLREYWPVLMLLAAVVVQGVAALLKRAKVTAVGDPLHNTSLVLPIVAPVAMLFFASDVTADVVLALSSVFYFALGATERSRQIAMVGGTLANVALLSFWSKFDMLDFTRHPQLWLIPPAASIALATHIERDRIPKEAASWLRYLCMATIFCSSSSEILIQGIGRSLWPPMVLMVLSLLVGFLGIAFQIRSYLYSGLLFTLFAVVAMVAHAQQSVQHTWPWWVLGISLGIGIMVLFGMFERKRDQLMKLSERLKSWQG